MARKASSGVLPLSPAASGPGARNGMHATSKVMKGRIGVTGMKNWVSAPLTERSFYLDERDRDYFPFFTSHNRSSKPNMSGSNSRSSARTKGKKSLVPKNASLDSAKYSIGLFNA